MFPQPSPGFWLKNMPNWQYSNKKKGHFSCKNWGDFKFYTINLIVKFQFNIWNLNLHHRWLKFGLDEFLCINFQILAGNCEKSNLAISWDTLIFLHLSEDIFICGYFYLWIFLSVDNFICGYFYTSIQIKIYWCKKSLFHHLYVIKLRICK